MDHPLSNRLKKRQAHVQKWAKRTQVTCYRLYERDLTDYPLILDWYNGEVVVWFYDRSKDDTEDKQKAFEEEVLTAIQEGLGVKPYSIFTKIRRKQKGLQQQYDKLSEKKVQRIVTENGLKFEVNLSDYLDTGLFLDHRNTRLMVKQLAHEKKVLNLFAYTGSFSCYAISGGAYSTVTVDLNKTYSEWTRRNFDLNGIPDSNAHRILTDDCRLFLKHEQKRSQYDIIVCDPPTFSNSKRTSKGTFSINEDYPELINQCLSLLSPKGVLFFSTNSRGFRLQENRLNGTPQLIEISAKTVPEDFQNKQIHRCWKMVSNASKMGI